MKCLEIQKKKIMLIDRIEILNHREISKNVRSAKINPFIEDAELLDLKPLLGSPLYFDLIANKNDLKYSTLLFGGTFLVNEITYSFVGLNKILSIFVDARYKLLGSSTDTAFGLVEKNNTDSFSVSQEGKKDIYGKNRQIAYQYFEDVKLFLDNNNETYPLWQKYSAAKRIFNGVRISKIS